MCRDFFSLEYEEKVIRPLAEMHLAHIPRGIESICDFSKDEIKARFRELPAPEQGSTFLRPAYERQANGEKAVRGTVGERFPENGPTCMYTALFDDRPCFDSIRKAFFDNAKESQCRRGVRAVLGDTEEGSGAWYQLKDLVSVWEKLQQARKTAQRSLNVSEEDLWQVYVPTVCSNELRYYLSCDELSFLAKLLRINAAVCTVRPNGHICLQTMSSGCGTPYGVICVRDGGTGRVRGHFQRLFPQALVAEYEVACMISLTKYETKPGGAVEADRGAAQVPQPQSSINSLFTDLDGDDVPELPPVTDAADPQVPQPQSLPELPPKTDAAGPEAAPVQGGNSLSTHRKETGMAVFGDELPSSERAPVTRSTACSDSVGGSVQEGESKANTPCELGAPSRSEGVEPAFEEVGASGDVSRSNAEEESGKERPAVDPANEFDLDVSMFTTLGQHDEQESSASEDAVSDISHESDASDVFNVCALPEAERCWLTEQDEDTNRIHALARRIRQRPLLPLKPGSTTEVFEEIDAGVMLPFVHCAFKKLGNIRF